jgi:DNA repair protein RadC
MITAALELARRRQTAPQRVRPQIRGSQDAFHIISPVLADLTHEEFWVILLNRANRVMACERVSSGGMVGTVVDGKIVFRKALEGLACSIILCHNHPSGNSQPSQADKALTKRLREAGKTLDIPVVDHIICGDKSYFSFADEGLL